MNQAPCRRAQRNTCRLQPAALVRSQQLRYWRWMLRLLILLGVLLPLGAQAVSWDELSAEQRTVLDGYRSAWTGMSDERQLTLARGAERWAKMNRGQRADIETRYQRWQQLPEAQRQRLLKRYNEFQSLRPAQQRALRQRLRHFRRLPVERQQALRERFRRLSPQERGRGLERLRERRANSAAGARPRVRH